jgi:tryptophan synthase beta subunit
MRDAQQTGSNYQVSIALIAKEVEKTAVVHELGDDEHGVLSSAHTEQLDQIRVFHLAQSEGIR